MTFTLLFDLDDTLLDTNLDAFLAAYFKKLAAHLAGRVPPERFLPAMMRSTQIMYASKRTDATMEQVFSENFYPALGLPAEELTQEIDRFYDEVFPGLAPLTTPRPQAVKLVEWAFEQGWRVAIATDPLFPRKANLHRLRWAGLDPDRYDFTLISDFQSFHFAKVSVAFYPEFLARMGWKDEPLLMVGDSYERDVTPSRAAGLPVYWLKTADQPAMDGVPQGGLDDLKRYLQSSELSSLKVDYNQPAALTAFLQATPAALHTFSLSTPAGRLSTRPAPGEWSFGEILCHLRDVDREVNLPRVEAILAEENPFIPAQVTDVWAAERRYDLEDPIRAMGEFLSARKALTDRLERLTSEDWQRPARHTIFGPTTLRELIEFSVDHDRLHIRQVVEALK